MIFNFLFSFALLGTLTLVDLAGSERLDQTASEHTNQETKNINLSLMELSKVLRSLQEKVSYWNKNASKAFIEFSIMIM